MTYSAHIDEFARHWTAAELLDFCMMFERAAQTTALTSAALGVYHAALAAIGRVEAREDSK